MVRAMAVAPGQTDSPVSVFELMDQVLAPVVHSHGIKVRSSSLGNGELVYLDKATVEASSESQDRPGFKIFYTQDGRFLCFAEAVQAYAACMFYCTC